MFVGHLEALRGCILGKVGGQGCRALIMLFKIDPVKGD